MEVLLLLLLAAAARAEIHSLQFSHIGSSGLSGLPEFMAVTVVDAVQTSYCDSINRTALARQDWVKEIPAEDPQFWRWNTEDCLNGMHTVKALIDSLKQQFNETGGVHIYQRMYGCEWDDETEEVRGFERHGYDGEDFLSFDLNSQTWVSHTPKADAIKRKRDRHRSQNKYLKTFLTQECPDQLKKYLISGGSALLIKELPSLFLLHKNFSSVSTCFATGFYPDNVDLFWRKDGKELHEDVYQGEVLPNHDGTFQVWTDLDISSIAYKDFWRYECVFRMSGVKDEVSGTLDKSLIEIKPAEGNSASSIISIVVSIPLTAGLIYLRIKVRAMLCDYRRV